MYQYNFKLDNCWYKEVCQKKDCNSSCIRYMEMDYLLYHSQIPKKQQISVSLSPESIDYDNFVFLADIKDGIVNFVDSGENLYITSEYTGNDKTSWAIYAKGWNTCLRSVLLSPTIIEAEVNE